VAQRMSGEPGELGIFLLASSDGASIAERRKSIICGVGRLTRGGAGTMIDPESAPFILGLVAAGSVLACIDARFEHDLLGAEHPWAPTGRWRNLPEQFPGLFPDLRCDARSQVLPRSLTMRLSPPRVNIHNSRCLR
jgi:hypothetical protein